MNKLAVYTALFGNRDKNLSNEIITSKINYFKFSGSISEKTPRLEARKYKCLSHEYLLNYEYSIWHDSSMQLKSINIIDLIDKLKDSLIGAYFNRNPRTVCQVAENCIKMKFDSRFKIKKQINKYLKEGMPDNLPSFETGILIRKNTSEIRNFNNLWWNEIKNGSTRDQISFPYLLWKLNINCQPLSFYNEENVANNPYFVFNDHGPAIEKMKIFI